RVAAVGRLLERRAIEGATPRPPAPLRVARDRPRLDLDEQEAAVGVGDDDVGLALALDAVVADDPGDVLEERELGRQRLAQTVVDVLLGARTDALGGEPGPHTGHVSPLRR